MAADDMHERYRRLNELLYDADPGDYFYVRLLSLVLMVGRPDDVFRLFADGVSYATLHLSIADAEIDPDGVRDFASVESQVQLHHAAESVLRLFVAHTGRPPCPWLDVAGETDFRRFKEKIEAEVLKVPATQLHDDVADVFLGGATPAVLPNLDETQLAAAVANVTAFVRVLAERWLSEARGYNSIKHGLSVQPSAAVARLASDDGQTFDIGNGPSLAFLERTPWDEQTGRRSWKITTQWLDVGEALGLVYVASKLLDNIWAVARVRYLGASPDRQLWVPHDLTPRSLRTPGNSRARMSMPTFIDEVRQHGPKTS